jgi:GT2 family glycosyltransferase
MAGLAAEVVVVDDASTDGSVAAMARRFPEVRTYRPRRRRGASAAKDLAARRARGDVLVFLDGHCKPEPWAIERLVNDVETFDGTVVATPRIPNLDPVTWQARNDQVGFGYGLDLEQLDCGWVALDELRARDGYYESPALCGCSFAVSRRLYFDLRGFDPDMVDWGVEDLDFSLKAWLVGEGILHNPYASIAHRFQSTFANYTVRSTAIPINQLRSARKNLGDTAWDDWLRRFRARLGEKEWQEAWAGFCRRRRSVEKERRYLFRRRRRDEYWYALRFGLAWPAR